MVVIGQNFFIRAEVAVFVQKWLHSGNKCCIWAKVVVFGQSGCIRAKMVVFGQSGGIRAQVVVFGQSCCIRTKWLYSGKVVVFE